MDARTDHSFTARDAAGILAVHGITKTFGTGETENIALADVSFTVEPGEFVSIVGPSGCGKTTLIKIIAGLMQPTAGAVEMFGKLVAGVPENLSVVFQDYSRSLFPWMRVAGNVAFPLTTLPISREERDARVAEALAAVGLGNKHRQYPWELSGGMQQRVAIARAIATRCCMPPESCHGYFSCAPASPTASRLSSTRRLRSASSRSVR